jgi:signal transduction histidine kinase
MNQMIEALLEMSRLARQPLAEAPVNLSSLVDEISASLRESDSKRDVHFLIQPGLQVRGDERLLRVVLENLVGNAWKFTRNRQDAHIEFGVTDRNGERTFFVRDDGAGFDMAGVNRLFNAFQRLHTSTEFEGAGVGLATVRRIIERHCGRVWAESQPGKGATFYFTLPGHPSSKLEK